MNIKVHLSFKDRIGIVADISTLIARHGFNIILMEVIRASDIAQVYVEAEMGRAGTGREEILEVLGKVPDLLEISWIDTLPQEERENRFRVVLDNISDGVISIDREGRITTINRMAKRALGCEDREVVGEHVRTLNLPDFTILECLEGKRISNLKKNLITGSRRYQYFATHRPIQDTSGRIIGAVEIARDMQEIKKLAQSISEPGQISFSDIIGRSPALTTAIAFAQKIAATDSIVAIRGESGTGKELFAGAMHTASGRTGPFVPVNCAAMPEQLLESELFGYVGGAFTGGRKEGQPGLFEAARDGTVFLDEIGEMPLGSQAKILRLIQEKSLRRIGATKEIPVNARIITATNRNLEQLVTEKSFRQDLYYRINVLPIHIPPLSERPDDIPLLVEHFLFQLASRLGKNVHGITADAMRKLCRHTWPGNVRELKNVIERAAILCESDQVDMDCILLSCEIGKSLKGASQHRHHQVGGSQSLKKALDQYEQEIIAQTMEKSRSLRQASRTLGLSHTALRNKLKKHQTKTHS